jgi:hypothetical protein
MSQARFDLNADSTASRKNRRPAFTIAAGLIALSIAAAIVVEERDGGAPAGTDPAHSSVVPRAAPVASRTASSSTMSDNEPAKAHFERSDEPDYEDSVRPHGG